MNKFFVPSKLIHTFAMVTFLAHLEHGSGEVLASCKQRWFHATPMVERPEVCQKLDEVCLKYSSVDKANKMFTFVLGTCYRAGYETIEMAIIYLVITYHN